MVRADAESIRRLDRIVVNSTAPHLCKNLAMENEVVDDGGLGSKRGGRVRGVTVKVMIFKFFDDDLLRTQ